MRSLPRTPGCVRRRHGLLWLLPLFLALWSGCAGSSGRVLSREMLLPFTEEQREAIGQAEAAPYVLQRGDVFAIETLIGEELRQPSIIVLPDGSATIIHLGNMRVAGRTVADLEQYVNEAYSKDFRDVKLNIVLQKVAGRMVYVLGEVNAPGLYDVAQGGVGIMGAIAMAGGFSDWSKQTSVVLLRLTSNGYLSREFNLKSLRQGEVFDPLALDLQPYDIIYVNRSRIGDFASFSRNVVASLTSYSRFVFDVRAIENPEVYRR